MSELNYPFAGGREPMAYMSAYALAVKNGFCGTEREWLESLYAKGLEMKYEGVKLFCRNIDRDEEWVQVADLGNLRGSYIYAGNVDLGGFGDVGGMCAYLDVGMDFCLKFPSLAKDDYIFNSDGYIYRLEDIEPPDEGGYTPYVFLCVGKWRGEDGKDGADGAQNIRDAEDVADSLRSRNACVLSDESVAFGRSNVVGGKAFYIKSIDLENKKIYLSKEQCVPVISTEDFTEASFDTPFYGVGSRFSIKLENFYGYCGTIENVTNNVVTFAEEALGFDEIPEITDEELTETNYTFRVPESPGEGVVDIGYGGFAAGDSNIAVGYGAVAVGGCNVADGNYAHAEGVNNYAAYASHAEGKGCEAIGNEAHAEGHKTVASAGNAHSEGQNTVASAGGSHAEGMGTVASGSQSHAEGLNSVASGGQAHAEGVGTKAQAYASHAEGNGCTASGKQAHAEGYQTIASGQASHSEGQQTEASGMFAHAQGIRAYAKAYAAFTSGADVEASGDVAAAIGKAATASARAAMAFGESVTASGAQSAAVGHGTKATAHGQMAVGLYNEENADALFIVGNGTSTSARSNAFVVDKDGKTFAGGKELCASDLEGVSSEVFLQKAIDSGLVDYIVNMIGG